jgi:hypothetical protein
MIIEISTMGATRETLITLLSRSQRGSAPTTLPMLARIPFGGYWYVQIDDDHAKVFMAELKRRAITHSEVPKLPGGKKLSPVKPPPASLEQVIKSLFR